jgi:orotidine-5'-phosphate decarboxylase
VAVKMQIAYFEALGAAGYRLYEDLVGPCRDSGLLVIADVKRGDIGSTAEAYAQAHLEKAGVDAVTVNPYLGSDSLEPFLLRVREQSKGIFVLVKTSNPSSAEIQDLELASGGPLYARIASLVNEWGRGTDGGSGYRSVGAVIGGTHPREASMLRDRMRGVPLLVPGYGAQGATARDLAGLFDEAGTGAVVNSSRAILYAYMKHEDLPWREAARREANQMRVALWEVAKGG